MSETSNYLVLCDAPLNSTQVGVDVARWWMTCSAYSKTARCRDRNLWMHVPEPNDNYSKEQRTKNT